jgi:hypothetical protein
MASQLLSNLQDLIDNAKQTPSGKVEWTDTSLKGIIEEILSLFASNGLQITNTTTSLQQLAGTDGQIAIVIANSDPTKNGIYSFSNTSSGVYYAAAGGGYWNLDVSYIIGNTVSQKYLSVDEANSQLELGQYVTTTGSHTVIDKWIKVNIPGVGTRYLPLYQ